MGAHLIILRMCLECRRRRGHRGPRGFARHHSGDSWLRGCFCLRGRVICWLVVVDSDATPLVADSFAQLFCGLRDDTGQEIKFKLVSNYFKGINYRVIVILSLGLSRLLLRGNIQFLRGCSSSITRRGVTGVLANKQPLGFHKLNPPTGRRR